MQRTLYAYKMEIQPVSEKKKLELESLENDFVEIIKKTFEKCENDRKQDFKQDKKILYLDEYEYNDEVGVVNFKFISAKYDSRRSVIDTETLQDKGILKNAGDGDKEKNHLCIKFIENNCAVCLYESNYYGIGFRRVISYLEKIIKDYHRENKDGCYYNLVCDNIVSNDFLHSLSQVRKIKAVTLTVDQENVQVSDYKALSGRKDISSDVDIMLKPAAAGIGINKDTVREFFGIYNNANRNVKRVLVQGDGENKQALSFDTEQMKQKIVIQVEATPETGEVITRDMFDKLFVEILPL